MKAARIISALLVLMVALFLISAWRIGILAQPQITERQVGPYYLIYREFTGPYQGIYQALDSLKVAAWFQQSGPSNLTFGFYLDQPDRIRPDSLRWLAGMVLTQPPERLDSAVKTAMIDRQPALSAQIRNKSRTAALIGPFVIYPKMENFARNHGYQQKPFGFGAGIIELYQGDPGENITYIMPVIKK